MSAPSVALSMRTDMIIGLTEAATMGDARAAKVIIDLIGEEDSQGEAGVEIIDDL